MTEFNADNDLQGATFTNVKLREARFDRVDLGDARFRSSNVSGVVMRAVDVDRSEIDAPWLYDGSFMVNDVDVVPLVDAELNRRFPADPNVGPPIRTGSAQRGQQSKRPGKQSSNG